MGKILVTITYINKHDSGINPGNEYEDNCGGTRPIQLIEK